MPSADLMVEADNLGQVQACQEGPGAPIQSGRPRASKRA